MMTEEQKEIIHETVKAYIESTGHQCQYDVDPGVHKDHHQAFARFMDTMDRIENVKWGALKTLISAIVLALFWFLWSNGIKGQ